MTKEISTTAKVYRMDEHGWSDITTKQVTATIEVTNGGECVLTDDGHKQTFKALRGQIYRVDSQGDLSVVCSGLRWQGTTLYATQDTLADVIEAEWRKVRFQG